MLKILKLTFILALTLQIGGAIILAGAPQAANAGLFKVNTTPLQFQPQVKIPGSEFEKDTVPAGTYVSGKTTSDLLAKYIKAFYNYGLAIAGILAAIVLMAGGVLWLTSAGNDAKVTQAKELISGSVIGAIILFGSWVILNTVNPELLKLKAISITTMQEMKISAVICCDPLKGEAKFDLIEKGRKIYYNSGDKKGEEFPGCLAATNWAAVKECKKNVNNTESQCLQYGDSWQCYNPDSVCCDCQIREVLLVGAPTYWACKKNITAAECDEWCKALFITSFPSTYKYPERYTCAGGAYSTCKWPGYY